MSKTWVNLCMVLVFFWGTACFKKSPRWIVFYGEDLSDTEMSKIDQAILEPDNISPKNFKNVPTKFIGYLSVGEAEEYRNYWFDITGKDFIVSKNPNWPRNYLVDIRSAEWQNLLLEKVIPPIINKGYTGLFLDTIDTAVYLEDTQPVKYAGSKKAMIDFIKKLRNTYPDITLIANNGLPLLMDIARQIDGVVVEDLYTRYDFKAKQNTKTPEAESQTKEKILDQFKNYYQKPVYNILYADSIESGLAQEAIQKSKNKGYEWYLTTVDLMKMGTVQE